MTFTKRSECVQGCSTETIMLFFSFNEQTLRLDISERHQRESRVTIKSVLNKWGEFCRTGSGCCLSGFLQAYSGSVLVVIRPPPAQPSQNNVLAHPIRACREQEVLTYQLPASNRRWSSVELMLGRRRRLWPGINSTLVGHLAIPGIGNPKHCPVRYWTRFWESCL